MTDIKLAFAKCVARLNGTREIANFNLNSLETLKEFLNLSPEETLKAL